METDKEPMNVHSNKKEREQRQEVKTLKTAWKKTNLQKIGLNKEKVNNLTSKKFPELKSCNLTHAATINLLLQTPSVSLSAMRMKQITEYR